MNSIESRTDYHACEEFVAVASPERLEALADMFELLSLAFSFPSPELAEALTSGDFQTDVNDCLEELGALAVLDFERGEDSTELYDSMKREYSRLFLSPGKFAVIYPYEGAFKFIEQGGEGFPALISNPITMDVERHMRAAFALPDTARTEPADSMYTEMDFVRLLYTHALSCRMSDANDSVEQTRQWLEKAAEFRSTHCDTWLPHLMQMTKELTRIPVYQYFSEVALKFFAL